MFPAYDDKLSAPLHASLPVQEWHPPHCGHSEMKICANGTWLHQGRAIARKELVTLFSRLLRKEADGRFVLVTPVEMLDIDVEDTPFLAVEVASTGQGRARCLRFRLNAGEWVEAGTEHGLLFIEEGGQPRPLLHVRHGLEARIVPPSASATK
jgi:uncharacterized protein